MSITYFQQVDRRGLPHHQMVAIRSGTTASVYHRQELPGALFYFWFLCLVCVLES